MKWAAIALLFLTITLVFSPGLDSQFQFDDIPNITNNAEIQIDQLSIDSLRGVLVSGHSGIFARPVSMLSFSLNYYFSELDPFFYKATNLAIHIANSVLIFFISRLLLLRILYKGNGDKNKLLFIPWIIALIWGVSPINLTPVLYVVQRMASLSAFFVFLGILIYLTGREALEERPRRNPGAYLALSFVAGCLAILSKENGALLFVFLMLIELVVYRGGAFYPNRNAPFIIFFSITLFVPLILISVYTLINPGWISHGYSSSAFNVSERLLTESRVLWSYVGWILLPDNQRLGLFHDDIEVSRGLIEPVTTLLAVLGHGAAIGCAMFLWVRQRLPGIVLGVMLFYTAHLMESTVIALEIAHEHRNYIASFGLIFALVVSVVLVHEKMQGVIKVGLIVYVSILIVVTVQRASDWGSGLESAIIDVQNHPQSAAAHYEVGRQYSALNGYEDEHFRGKAEEAFRRAANIDKQRADGIFALIMFAVRQQKEIDPALLNELVLRLQNGPIYATHPSWLKTLVNCYKNTGCEIEKDVVMRALQAALDNPNVGNAGISSAVTLAVSAEFLGHIGAYENALEMSILATERTRDNHIFIISLINLALYYNDINVARTWIQKLENRNYLGVYDKTIAKMNADIMGISQRELE